MDGKRVREIMSKRTAEQISAYLASRSFDRDITQMSAKELIAYMKDQPRLKEQDECAEALNILRYNEKPGTLKDYDCPVCRNKGRILHITDDGVEYYQECSCMPKRRSIRYARQSGLGDLLKKNLEEYETPEDWQKQMSVLVRQYISVGGEHWLCICGQSGCGKTHLCSAAANAFLHRGKQTVYMVWNTAVKELKQLAADSEYQRLFNRYADAEVLYIDDLFKGTVTDADYKIAFELINYRYNRPELVTIVSSEMLLTEIAQKDAAIAGRIKERCGHYVLQIRPDGAKNYRFRDLEEL